VRWGGKVRSGVEPTLTSKTADFCGSPGPKLARLGMLGSSEELPPPGESARGKVAAADGQKGQHFRASKRCPDHPPHSPPRARLSGPAVDWRCLRIFRPKSSEAGRGGIVAYVSFLRSNEKSCRSVHDNKAVIVASQMLAQKCCQTVRSRGVPLLPGDARP